MLNCVPQNSKVLTPEPKNVTVFRHRVYNEVTKLKQGPEVRPSFSMTPSEELIRMDTHARAHTECPLKTWGEDGHLPSGEKGLPKPAL